jgi:hypothetical protein
LSALGMQAEAVSHDSYADDPAAAFLAALDPDATEWTFQTFDDNKERAKAYKMKHGRADPELTRIIHGSLAVCRGTLQRLNDRGCGVFVTVNQTNLKAVQPTTSPGCAPSSSTWTSRRSSR